MEQIFVIYSWRRSTNADIYHALLSMQGCYWYLMPLVNGSRLSFLLVYGLRHLIISMLEHHKKGCYCQYCYDHHYQLTLLLIIILPSQVFHYYNNHYYNNYYYYDHYYHYYYYYYPHPAAAAAAAAIRPQDRLAFPAALFPCLPSSIKGDTKPSRVNTRIDGA